VKSECRIAVTDEGQLRVKSGNGEADVSDQRDAACCTPAIQAPACVLRYAYPTYSRGK